MSDAIGGSRISGLGPHDIRLVDSLKDRLVDAFGLEPPRWIINLGSGLGAAMAILEDPVQVPYQELGLPDTSVSGHAGVLAVGRVDGTRVACFSGRVHVYEGHEPATVVLGLRAVFRWGQGMVPQRLVTTSAVGGIHEHMEPGSLILVKDHLNFSGVNVLRGPNLPELGDRFPDISGLYDLQLRQTARRCARRLGFSLVEGVYAATLGPSYETPAEIRMLKAMGADLVGMSLVHEAIAACHARIPVLAIAVISNLAAGLSAQELSQHEVEQTIHSAGSPQRLARLLESVIRLSD